jgi:hypothetical protein
VRSSSGWGRFRAFQAFSLLLFAEEWTYYLFSTGCSPFQEMW